jgi:phosphate transport system protein
VNSTRTPAGQTDRVAATMATSDELEVVDRKVTQLFALVSQALAQATHALLHGETDLGRQVVEGDQVVDDLTSDVELLVWQQIDRAEGAAPLRQLVGLLLILPELERSADLAEHVAQRAVDNLGSEMSPVSRGIVQRMTEVALDMWRTAADAYGDRESRSEALAEEDVEMDLLRDRLLREIAAEETSASVASQVTLLARFYERLGDHAVNLARRIELLDAPR